MEIKQQLVANRDVTYRGNNPCNFITIHETANYSRGAGAQAHANLQSRGYHASWHYQVDDKEIIQSFPDHVQCWHAGDGRGLGNTESIAIEICVNIDSDFNQAVENTARLVKHLIDKHDIPINRVVQHHRWSGKNCPANLRSGAKGVTWQRFISMIRDIETSDATVTPPTPSTNNQGRSGTTQSSTYTGNSIVDYLNSLGIDSSQMNRRRLAAQYGVRNYDFSAAKNLELLNKMRGTNQAVSAPSAPSTTGKSYVHLPASASTWRTYSLDVQPVKRNSDWSLTPSRYGGLTYEILGRPFPNVVTIQTSRGKRNIYVGPDTDAIITER